MVAGTSTGTTEFLGLHTAGIGNKEGLVVADQLLLKLTFGRFIVVLLVVGNNSLGNGLTDSHDLGGGTTADDANADVKIFVTIGAEEENGLPNLHTEGSGFDELDRFSVHVDEAFAEWKNGALKMIESNHDNDYDTDDALLDNGIE